MQLSTIKIYTTIGNYDNIINEINNRVKRVQELLTGDILNYNYWLSCLNEINELNQIKENINY